MRQRGSFTIIELILVIVVIGILASLSIPRIKRDRQIEAINNILSSIRYTQHLALIDDKVDPNDSSWQKRLWGIRFANTNNSDAYYTICSDINENGYISKNECAIDNSNGKYFYRLNTHKPSNDESPNTSIGRLFGINSITFSGGCKKVKHIAFDKLGRPHVGLKNAKNDYRTYMSNDCKITFKFIDNTPKFTITIVSETGYVYVSGDETGNINYSNL